MEGLDRMRRRWRARRSPGGGRGGWLASLALGAALAALCVGLLEARLRPMAVTIAQAQLQNDAARLVERCVTENARVALDQDEYTQRYNGLVSRYEAVKAQFDEVTQAVADKADRKKLLEQFLHTVEGQAPVTEFDERLWSSLVDFVTVYSEKGIRVTFKDGTEIQV